MAITYALYLQVDAKNFMAELEKAMKHFKVTYGDKPDTFVGNTPVDGLAHISHKMPALHFGLTSAGLINVLPGDMSMEADNEHKSD
jgi:hypothetical protein